MIIKKYASILKVIKNPLLWVGCTCLCYFVIFWAHQAYIHIPQCNTAFIQCLTHQNLLRIHSLPIWNINNQNLTITSSPALWCSVLLVCLWSFFFGVRWLWARWHIWQKQKNTIDFTADEYDALVWGWKNLAHKQLVWIGVGLFIWGIHFLTIGWNITGISVWLASEIDLFIFLAISCKKAAFGKPIRLGALALPHKSTLIISCLSAILLALVWIINNQYAIVTYAFCPRTVQCLANYQLLYTPPYTMHTPIIFTYASFGIQIFFWCICLLLRHVLAPKLGVFCPPSVILLSNTLLAILPAYWIISAILPPVSRAIVEISVATVAMLYIFLLLELIRSTPNDSMYERIVANKKQQYWLRRFMHS